MNRCIYTVALLLFVYSLILRVYWFAYILVEGHVFNRTVTYVRYYRRIKEDSHITIFHDDALTRLCRSLPVSKYRFDNH